MSGITGCYNLDGKPADRALIQRMMHRLAHRGPDGSAIWMDGPVGLAHLALHTTPESLRETQPLCNEARTICLTLDGRVDNRTALQAALEARAVRLRSNSDAELVLRAYECWGIDCPHHIIGDFAFVVWDRLNQQLFCARDILGTRPFYYCRNDRRLLWASELRALFEDETVRTVPNEEMIGEYLANAIMNNEETLFRDIVRLPPAHCLLVGSDHVRVYRYWNIDPLREIRYRRAEDYAEHFLSLFKEAARSRLRSHRPIGADLSGGLDSSSVVSMAQLLYQEGAVPNQGLETFSLVFPGLACDESSYIRDVAQRWELPSNRLVADMQPLDHYVAQVERDFDFPEYPNSAMSTPLRMQARAKGITVILDGSGGDEWLSGSDCHYADLVRTGRFLRLFRQVDSDRRATGGDMPSWPLLRLGLWPLMPLAMRKTIRRLSKRDGVPPWMTPQFARHIHLTERLRLETVRRTGSSFAQEAIDQTLLSGWQSHGNEMGDRLSARLSMEERSPLNDRRIIEFACAVPEEQHWEQERSKCLLRDAMKGLLPESVRNRDTKADFSHTFAETLRTQGGSILLDSLRTEERGWVRGEQVRSMYRAMIDLYGQGDSRYTQYIWPLWMIFGIEVWLSTVMDKKGERGYGTGQAPSPFRYDGKEAVCHPVPSGVR